MPNHLHMIINFNKKEKLGAWIRDVKKKSSAFIRDFLLSEQPGERFKIVYVLREQRHKIWDDGYHARPVFKTWFLKQKLNYIHNNPLQEHWKLVEYPEDYRYSSARFYHSGEQADLEVVHFAELFLDV